MVESIYGRFIVNRHCSYQAESLIKTGAPHIDREVKLILKIVGTLPKDCIVVDAGANIGLISIPIARAIKEKRGIIHAFEPQRMLFYALSGAAALNDLDNLFVHHNAVGAAPGVLKLPRIDYGTPQDFGMVSLARQEAIAEHERVSIVAIDALELPHLDLLKIDVEGMELEVLKGARRTINTYRPWCWIEYWKVDENAIKEAFSGLDYRFYLVDPLNMLCAPGSRVAEQRIQIGLKEDPPASEANDPVALNNRALQLHEQGQYEQALATYDKALAIKPDLVEVLYNRGNALLALKRDEEALVSYDKALAVREDYVPALNNRAWVLHQRGRLEDALACYEKVIAIDPGHAIALQNHRQVLDELERARTPAADVTRRSG